MQAVEFYVAVSVCRPPVCLCRRVQVSSSGILLNVPTNAAATVFESRTMGANDMLNWLMSMFRKMERERAPAVSTRSQFPVRQLRLEDARLA